MTLKGDITTLKSSNGEDIRQFKASKILPN